MCSSDLEIHILTSSSIESKRIEINGKFTSTGGLGGYGLNTGPEDDSVASNNPENSVGATVTVTLTITAGHGGNSEICILSYSYICSKYLKINGTYLSKGENGGIGADGGEDYDELNIVNSGTVIVIINGGNGGDANICLLYNVVISIKCLLISGIYTSEAGKGGDQYINFEQVGVIDGSPGEDGIASIFVLSSAKTECHGCYICFSATFSPEPTSESSFLTFKHIVSKTDLIGLFNNSTIHIKVLYVKGEIINSFVISELTGNLIHAEKYISSITNEENLSLFEFHKVDILDYRPGHPIRFRCVVDLNLNIPDVDITVQYGTNSQIYKSAQFLVGSIQGATVKRVIMNKETIKYLTSPSLKNVVEIKLVDGALITDIPRDVRRYKMITLDHKPNEKEERLLKCVYELISRCS